ncbi:hypothetical protein CPB84DRAFT_1807267 [Gymnopilus junonius]|uniref:Phosphotransferase enzyme family protein n=1 Tax=Gymnopilus junonius TaxID=109634 RepID=A0A9P5N8C6_GYMJU|nr:hypothetical protein CPB84DRAFT_1807267 [Gymnopilus junonius]
MEFARDVLKIPTPRSQRPKQPVGAEYIIMEKAPGMDLRTRWPLITSGLDVIPLVNDFIDIENKFEGYVQPDRQFIFQGRFDLEADEDIKAAAERYRVGPLTDRQWWRGGRADLDIDRGPWFEPLSYFTAAVQCELTFIQSPAASAVQFRQNPFVPLSLYKRILHLLLDELCAPTLWHPDANITSVIDWQFAQIAPYFTHAVFPSMLLYTDDVLPVPPGLQFPKLPADYDSYSPEKQAYIRRHHRLIMRQKSYQALRASRGTERRKAASKVPHAALLTMLPYYTLRAWSHGPHLLMDALGDIQELWTAIVQDDQTKCPMDDLSPDFEAELAENASVFEALEYYDVSVTRMMKAVGCTGDGLVSYEDYESAREECDRLKVMWDQQAEGKPFPFADGMFSFFLS